MPPNTKLVPSAAKPSSDSKRMRYFYQPQAAFGVQKKKASAISIIINWRI
jgi:hypothetical protein